MFVVSKVVRDEYRRPLPSYLLLRNSDPHSFLDEEPIIHVLFKWLERIDQAPIEPPEHFKEHFVELDLRNTLSHTPESAKPEHQVKSLLHPCQSFRTCFEPSLWSEDMGIFTIRGSIVPLNVPCTEAHFGTWRQVDVVVRVALGANNSWKKTCGCGVMAKCFFDTSLEVWKL
jgi:hypothetical protein